MINIMVVDDESIFREWLIKSIKWENYGFKVACEGKNGVDALEKIKDYEVDIAIVDISMPFMDGLELSKQLKERYPNIDIVIITAHDEFQYAKKAIKLGVSDYILKPFDKEELILTLLKVKTKHESLKQTMRIEKNYKKKLKEILLSDLVTGSYDEDNEIIEQLKDCGISFNTNRFKVIAMEINHINQKWDRTKEGELWRFAAVNIWNELLEEEQQAVTFFGDEERIVSIIELENFEDLDEGVCHRFCELLKNYLDFSIIIGIGNIYEGVKNIEKSYKEALVALQNKYRFVDENVIFYNSLEAEDSNIASYSLLVNEDILIHLRLKEWDLIQKKLDRVKQYVVENRFSMEYTYAIYMALVSSCLSFLEERGGKVGEVFGGNFHPFIEIKHKKTIVSLNEWTREIFSKVISYSKDIKITKSNKLALAAKEYIDSNYNDEELTVESVANHLYVNSSYLRSAFKQEIGLQISKYILELRMEKAKELLQKKDIKIADITDLVGYSDAGYFSKVFKKYFGISPSEFENINKK